MSHPFGDQISQRLHQRHGLSQAMLAEGIQQAPTVISAMCKGQRLTGPQARERVLAIIGWLRAQTALETLAEANALLNAAGMAPLKQDLPSEAALVKTLRPAAHAAEPPAQTRRHGNLLAQITSFIGREGEIRALNDQIKSARMVTLVGAGGIGKTRLAIELAGRLRDEFEDGIWFINLAPVSDPSMLAQVIASTLKLIEQPGREPIDILLSFLEERHVLLIIDNCEHLIEASAEIAATLLGAAPRLHVLATSRETLSMTGEVAHRVRSLALSDAHASPLAAVQASESVTLFVDRARASQPAMDSNAIDAAAIARICRQLDGIPLAIELAAAMTLSMTVREIEARLSDQLMALEHEHRGGAPRHRTMRAALEWSYTLLTSGERRGTNTALGVLQWLASGAGAISLRGRPA